MENKFCPRCGKPLAECECSTRFGEVRSERQEYTTEGKFYTQRFEKIALAQGETVVRQYHIGEFRKGFIAGKGSASVIITNRRVISNSESAYLGSTSVGVEEISLENVAGVNNYFAKGFSISKIVIGVICLIVGIVLLCTNRGYNSSFIQTLLGLAFLALAGYMGYKCRQPSYLFSVYSTTTSQALQMGLNLRGKLFTSNGNGIVFQYKPTEDAVKMMQEMGACIMDLKTKGDYAIEAWKNA